jgi:GT2 family glycosyltransferase
MLATSVVISTYSRPDGVLSLLCSLARQTVIPKTIYIIDQSKGNLIKSAIDVFLRDNHGFTETNCRHVRADFQGLTKSRNFGLSLVDTPVITFIDDDVEVGPTYIEQVMRFFEEKRGVLLGGVAQFPGVPYKGNPAPSSVWTTYRKIFNLSRPGSDWRLLRNFEIIYQLAPQSFVEADFISGSNFSVSTAVAKEFKFDEKLIWYSIGEDLDFPLRLKRRYQHGVWIDPTLPVFHPLPPEKPLTQFLLLIHACHHYYLFKKQWDGFPPLGELIQFVRARLGHVFMPALQKRRVWVFPDPELLLRSIKAEMKVLGNVRAVFSGKFPIEI